MELKDRISRAVEIKAGIVAQDEKEQGKRALLNYGHTPMSTPWMEALKNRKVEVHGGLSMLIFQAAKAFKLWTGHEAPVDAMRKAALDEIKKRT